MKTNLKKLLSITLACVMLVVVSVSGIGSVAFADENNSFAIQISSIEETFANSCLSTRGIMGESESEIVFDQNDEPTYLLTVSDNGYAIIDRETKAVLESGESNPYRNYTSNKKYFGGVTMYFIEDEIGLYDFLRNSYINEIATADYILNQRAQSVENVAHSKAVAIAQPATITHTKIIPNAYNYIQRKAFGYNGSSYANTCTAVATAIVLNYLDLQYNDAIVPNNFESETLMSPFNHDINYPQADTFHKYLVDTCSLGVAHFAYAISNAVATYSSLNTTVAATGLTAEWTANFGSQFGIDELDKNKPTLLTSTFADADVPSWHTMAIYGYREYSDGKKEWLVHTGWYSSLNEFEKKDDFTPENIYMPITWVPENTATFLYRFNYNS